MIMLTRLFCFIVYKNTKNKNKLITTLPEVMKCSFIYYFRGLWSKMSVYLNYVKKI